MTKKNPEAVLSKALTACAALPPSMPLWRTARAMVNKLWVASGKRPAGLGLAVGVSTRGAQRLLLAFGLRERDLSKINHGARRPTKRTKRAA